MDYKIDGPFNNDFILFSEAHNKPWIWLYNLHPVYLISRFKDEDKKTYAFETLLRSYTAYSVRYSTNKSVQYIQGYTYNFSLTLLKNLRDETISFDTFKTELDAKYNETFGEYIKKDLSKDVKRLDYEQSQSQSAIRGIFCMMEYNAQKAVNRKSDGIRLMTCGEVELDHILPQNMCKVNTEDEEFWNSFGNLTPLEQTLNRRKQDDVSKNSDIYNESSFIITKLIVKDRICGNIPSQSLKKLYDYYIPHPVSEEDINNYSLELMKTRRNDYAYSVVNMLQVN
jgi:hypothetical protein